MKTENEIEKEIEEEIENEIDEVEDEVDEFESYSKEELLVLVKEQYEQIVELEDKIEKVSNGSGRKSQVLDLLKSNASISIVEIADALNISTKNVSSQLTYLRSDGYKIFTDNNGRKILMT